MDSGLIAVTDGEEELTYGDLDARASQLALLLRDAGVGRDVLVGLCMQRSLDMLVGMLGILKAGGAVVALDPADPKRRLASILQICRPTLLLTQQRLLDRVPHVANVVCVDGEWNQVPQRRLSEHAANVVGPENLAFLAFSPRHSAQLKGSMIPHKAISNALLWQWQTYHVGNADRILFHTPSSYQSRIWDLFLPLIAGSRLVIDPQNRIEDTDDLIDFLVNQEVTLVQSTPSKLSKFLDSNIGTPGSLRGVICYGEALPTALQERASDRLGVELYNLYGALESPIAAGYQDSTSAHGLRITPIGRPVANTKIYILDENLQPLPTGVPGEIHVGGPGLATGYFRNPDLTATRFVPDPFADEPGARLFKTGDRAKFLEDGTIAFMGRLDRQSKIRWIAIEPEEIEAELVRHESARSAAVISTADEKGEEHLIALVVPIGGRKCSNTELLGQLNENLPRYMVPTTVMPVDNIPMSTDGRLDAGSVLKDIEKGALRPDGCVSDRTSC